MEKSLDMLVWLKVNHSELLETLAFDCRWTV